MHILLFQHETLKAYRKSPVKTFSVKLAMQCYIVTLNFNNAPTFSLFIYTRICLVCRENAFNKILHFFGLWNQIFRDRSCEYVSRKPIDLYKPHWTFSEPASPDQIINTSFSILYFSRMPFHTVLHISSAKYQQTIINYAFWFLALYFV